MFVSIADTKISKLAETSEDGGLTIFGLYLFLGMVIVGGIAIDFANLTTHRTHLQITADVAAHAAIVTRQNATEGAAKVKAIELASGTMPAGRHGSVLTAADVQFGAWNASTEVFTPSATSKTGVLVETSSLSSKSNPVSAFLLHLVGFGTFDVRTRAVYETYKRSCLNEGFVAEKTVDLRSNNDFLNDFCIHSNGHVELQNHNYFESGTRVTMPNKDDLVIPGNGWAQNPGLADALGEDEFSLDIIDDLPDIFSDLYNLNSNTEHWPSYVTDTSTLDTINSGGTYDDSDFTDNRVTWVNCNGNQGLTIAKNTTLTNVAIITDCAVTFKNGGAMEDALIFTISTSANSFKSPQGLRLGKDDGCAAGGGAQLLTLGGTNFASKLQMYGGQIIGAGAINFSANANGIEGASIISGDEISGTSNMEMGLCEGAGTEDNFTTTYFRLAG